MIPERDGRKITLIEESFELGAGTRGSSLGADAFLLACVAHNYNWRRDMRCERVQGNNDALWDDVQYEHARRIKHILELNENIATTVQATLDRGDFPLIISGDHSNAIGNLAGIKRHYGDKRMGVIWLDAHGDIHSPFSSPTGNIHGMPMMAALNLAQPTRRNNPRKEALECWEGLVELAGTAPMVKPEDLYFLGIRDLEEEEWDTISRSEVAHFSSLQVNLKGVEAVADAVVEHMKQCEVIHLSFDIDVLDASLVQGTGTPVEGGLSLEQIRYLLHRFWELPQLAAFEISEINPLLDQGNRAAEIAAELTDELLTLH